MWRLRRIANPLWLSSSRVWHQIRHLSEPLPCAKENNVHANTQQIAERIRQALPRRAREMIDDGVLSRLDNQISDENRYQDILREYLRHCRTAEERHEAVVSFSLLVSRFRLLSTLCETCLYHRRRCICRDIEAVSPRHHLWVFQHHGEYGRSNNTGSLLCLVAGAKRAIRGVREDQDLMMQHLESHKESAVILFPTQDSLTMDQYQRQRLTALGTHAKEVPLTIVLLDGTSRQAKNLDRYMPEFVPRVRLGMPRVKSWLDPIRRQTEEHRVCTAQGKL